MAKSVAKSQDNHADAEFPLLGYVDELVDKLRKHIPAALKEFDEDAVHDARVATRRLKAAVDLMGPVLSKSGRKPFARVLKNLRRRLGPLRDLDVMLGHLEEFARNRKHTAAAGWLTEHLTGQRKEAREKAAGKNPTTRTLSRLGTWWGLREEVAEAGDAVGPLLAESVHLQLDAFAEQADHVACGAKDEGRRARPERSEGMKDEGKADGNAATGKAPDSAPDSSFSLPPSSLNSHVDPHEVRIAGKALRYTLEMAVVDGHPLPADVARAFKRMQEVLGLWHDYVVLTETALRASLDAVLALHDPPLQAAVLELARATLQRSARELDKFSAKWRDRGHDLTHTIRAAFPLTRSLQESQAAAGAVTPPGEGGAGKPGTDQPAEAETSGAETIAAETAPTGETTAGAMPTATAAATVTARQTGPGPFGSAGLAAPAKLAPGATSAV